MIHTIPSSTKCDRYELQQNSCCIFYKFIGSFTFRTGQNVPMIARGHSMDLKHLHKDFGLKEEGQSSFPLYILVKGVYTRN